MEIIQKRQRTYLRKNPKSDFLKWWRVIRRYTCVRYNLTGPDLDMLLYLYSEGLFDYWTFQEYANCFGWDRGRFARLKENGWVHVWSKKNETEYKMYEVTRHGRHVIGNMYKMLCYDMEIPEHPTNNPLIGSKKYSDKVLAISVKKFNEEVRKQNPTKRIEY